MSKRGSKKFKQPTKHQEFHQYTEDNDDLEEVQNQEVIEQQTLDDVDIHNFRNNKRSKKQNKDQSNCKSAFLFILLCVVIMGLIFLVSIAANCLLEHQNLQPANNISEDWNKKTSSTANSQLSQNRIKQLEEAVDQLNIRNKQISEQLNANRRNPGSADAQTISRLQTQVRVNQQRSNQAIKQLSNQNQQLLRKIRQSQRELQKSKALLDDIQNSKSSDKSSKTTDKPNNSQSDTPKTPQQKTSAPTKYKVRQHFRDSTPKSQPNYDRYEFTTSIQNVVDSSSMKYMFPNQNSQWGGLKKSTYQRAIRLMQVVHNINIKGQMQFDHFNFYSSAEEKYKAFSKILQEEYDYYDKKYQIGKYNKNQIGICISSPTFNSAQKSRLYLRNLDSVFQQQYDNYHIVVTNDASTDGTKEYLQNYMKVNNIPADKYTIINNQKNMGGSHNTYVAGHEHCKLGQIMIYLDGDDVLIGRQVFSFLNAFYQRQKCTLTYGQFLLVRQNSVSSGFSTPIPQRTLQDGTFRRLRAFYTSHLKSMYVDVFRAIPENHFHYDNGSWFDYAFDVVFMTPGVELSGPRAKFVNELIYQYRFDTGGNQPGYQQKRVQMLVYEKPALKRLQDFSFADNPKTKSYP